MAKLSRQINPWMLAHSCALITLLLAAPATAQEAGDESTSSVEGEDAQPAAAPVEQPPPTPSDDTTTDSEPTTDEAGGNVGVAPVDETSQDTTSLAAEQEGNEATGTDVGEADTEEEEDEVPRYFQFGHRFQGGIGFVVGSGYFFEAAYGGSYCYMEDEPEPSVCHGRTPVFFDFQLSFGVTDGLEILLEYRLGLLEESFGGDEGVLPTTSRPMAFGFGIRYFIGATNRIKAFLGALLDIDFTQGLKVDVFVRPLFGLQIEIVRWVAFFLQGSVNLSFVRSFGIALDAGGGLQFRFP